MGRSTLSTSAKQSWAYLIAISLCLLAAQTSAFAQTSEDKAPDQSSIRFGRVLISPKLTTSTQFNDNIYLAESSPKSDLITTISPRISIESDWQTFGLRLAAGADLGLFAKSKPDDYQDLELTAAGDLKIGDATLQGSTEWRRAHDPRGGNDVPTGADEPVIYHDMTTRAGARYVSTLLRYETEVSLRRLAFDDSRTVSGNLIRNDDRDRLEMRETLRFLVPIDRGREVYGEVTLNQRQYDSIPDDTGIVRDSSGYQLFGGLRVDLTNLISADLAAGWMSQTYSDQSFGDINDYTLRANTDWAVTRLTSINLDVARTIRETTLTGASGVLAFEAGLGVTHELRRGLDIGVSAGHIREQFKQITRHDEISKLGASLSYDLNRFARIDAAINHDRRSSNSAGHDYRRFQTQISLKLEM
ncbi:MAG: outer membrane beta-barrel protein [Thalassospira sp.]|uniref:outer membrane beta-barrel protein n=1 Tax=Thalassospira sp. TaxID=1912094 RepID=UPI003A890AA8